MMAETALDLRRISYPVCGMWDCDDIDYDWDVATPADPEWKGVRREHQIVTYHQPRSEWRDRLMQERDEENHGRPLWAPAAHHP